MVSPLRKTIICFSVVCFYGLLFQNVASFSVSGGLAKLGSVFSAPKELKEVREHENYSNGPSFIETFSGKTLENKNNKNIDVSLLQQDEDEDEDEESSYTELNALQDSDDSDSDANEDSHSYLSLEEEQDGNYNSVSSESEELSPASSFDEAGSSPEFSGIESDYDQEINDDE